MAKETTLAQEVAWRRAQKHSWPPRASQIPPLAFPLVFPAPWRRTEALRRKTCWRGFAPLDLYPVPWNC